jgi:hypothetical protein
MPSAIPSDRARAELLSSSVGDPLSSPASLGEPPRVRSRPLFSAEGMWFSPSSAPATSSKKLPMTSRTWTEVSVAADAASTTLATVPMMARRARCQGVVLGCGMEASEDALARERALEKPHCRLSIYGALYPVSFFNDPPRNRLTRRTPTNRLTRRTPTNRAPANRYGRLSLMPCEVACAGRQRGAHVIDFDDRKRGARALRRDGTISVPPPGSPADAWIGNVQMKSWSVEG